MAVVVRKNQAGDDSAQRDKHVHGSGHAYKVLIPVGVAAGALLTLALGFMSGPAPTPVDAAKAAPAAKVVKSGVADGKAGFSAPADPAQLRAEGGRLAAAMLAYRKDFSQAPATLDVLSPLYLSEGLGVAQHWTIAGDVLERAGLSEENCRAISPTRHLSAIDKGDTGLHCVSDEGLHKAVYRIEQGVPPAKGFWRIDVKGQFDTKLSTWQVLSDGAVLDACEGGTTLDAPVELSAANPTYSKTLCLPAYAVEVTPISNGLSLLEGSDVVAVKLGTMEVDMTLEVVAQACDFGRRVVSQLSLTPSGAAPDVSVLSCDLKSVGLETGAQAATAAAAAKLLKPVKAAK